MSNRAGFYSAVWCNGSTQVGKGQSLPTGDAGSSPATATKKPLFVRSQPRGL